jgi:hypothetical protein
MSRALALFMFLAISSLFSVVLLPQMTHAQTTGADPLTLDASPQYPAPYQPVVITPSSSVFDIANSTITIKVNGKAFYEGTGGQAVSVPMGGPGSVTDVEVTISGDGQSPDTKDLVFHPSSVALVVEPVTSTHPFYEGASLVTSEGRVRIVAMPDLRTTSNKILDPSTLTYTWSLGDQELDSDSGVGKSVLDASAPQEYRDADVSVVVSSPDGNEIAEADTTISPTTPVTLIYKNDPLLGPLYDNALSNSVTMTDPEDTYRGVPYYFSDTPEVTWEVNGTPSATTDDITVRSSGTGTGTALLQFSAADSATDLSTDSTLSVNFGQTSSGGILGL